MNNTGFDPGQKYDISYSEIENVLEFYSNYYHEDIAELAQKFPNDAKSLWIDYQDLYRFDMKLADDLVNKPDRQRYLFSEALAEFEVPIDVELGKAAIRIHNVPKERKIDELRDDDVDTLRSIKGQISKASAVRPVVKQAMFECQRCGTLTPGTVDDEITQPHECQGCERQGPFHFDYDQSEVRNHQLIRIKQPPEEATNSQQHGNQIDAHVEGDLVGYAEAGERAEIPGVLRTRTKDNQATLEFYFDAWAVDQDQEDYSNLDVEEYREEITDLVEQENPFVKLADSIAPGITGGDDIDIETPWGEEYDKYWWIRLSAGIANLFGSWRRSNNDGTHHRGSSHTLFVGDPSTGKSTIMNAIENVSPRSSYESGKNASGAGLTAAAVKDDFGDSQWSLEAGALVKAHNGVACIDEIDKMEKADLSRLHSALEKQRLEINKAGIDATLQCETSLLASGNPSDSRFNRFDSDQEQINIVESLMDRFDLVYTLKDVPDEDKDSQIADIKIDSRTESGLVARNELEAEERDTGNPEMPEEKLKAWVALARREYRPVVPLDSEVKERLKEFYVEIRLQNKGNSDDEDAPVPATVRTLDGLMRLSEASARMRLSQEVEMIDAEMAIAMVKTSLQDIGYDPETGKMDIDYAEGRGSFSQKQRLNISNIEHCSQKSAYTSLYQAHVDKLAAAKIIEQTSATKTYTHGPNFETACKILKYCDSL